MSEQVGAILGIRVFVDDSMSDNQIRLINGFPCPYCKAVITPGQRMSYPRAAIGQFAPVYRCKCGRHIGEPLCAPVVEKC